MGILNLVCHYLLLENLVKKVLIVKTSGGDANHWF